jgi:Calcineurin-like phosphoesterase
VTFSILRHRHAVFFAFVAVILSLLAQAQREPSANDAAVWHFAVSGDSRNCGNVIMPAIAAGAKKNGAAFYWHLGDLRATYDVDEDYKAEPEHRGRPVDKSSYLGSEWPDFIQNQIAPFDPLPFFVGIGNHEIVEPKTRAEFVTQFSRWLDSPTLQKQRAADVWDQGPRPRTYYHWIQGGIDFIYLDNATRDQFDPQQVNWLENVLRHASSNSAVHGVVVGMHQALPQSLAAVHSMNDWPLGISTGQRIYADLLRFKRKTHKPVYVLASHSHFYMSGIFENDYWRMHGGVLPGWIVGTAGAFRYRLPSLASRAKEAKEKVYGYLLGSVHQDGKIDFVFQEIQRGDIPESINQQYTPQFVDYCFNENFEGKAAESPAPK